MTRRDLFKHSARFGLVAGLFRAGGISRCLGGDVAAKDETSPPPSNPLVPPADSPISVAFVVSRDAVLIDFAGPWEVFQDVRPAPGESGFASFTVAQTLDPVVASGGLTIIPQHTFQTALAPRVVVIPAQSGESPAMLDWIRASAKTADLVMSVCTGASILAKTGLLAGKTATTHHGAYAEFAMAFPDVRLQRGVRFVEDGKLASSGGLSSGIDLALRVVERYYGRPRAEQTADTMEYQGRGWLDPASNQIYTRARLSTDEHPLCPVCSMEADRMLRSDYKGRAYYFCMPGHKTLFDQAPDRFVQTSPATTGH